MGADDLELGDLVRVPHETLRSSWIYTDASFDWDDYTFTGDLLGGMVPGPHGPALMFFFMSRNCQVAIYGAGPPRIVFVDDMRCTTAGLSPEGYVLLGGVALELPEGQPRWVLVDPDGAVVTRGPYPAEITERVSAGMEDPDYALFNITSIVWREDRFMFSASAGVVDGTSSALPGAPSMPAHVFYGEVTLTGEMTLIPLNDADVQDGSCGWLVMDEAGVHSLLTVFDPADDPTTARLDLLGLNDGERTTIVGPEPEFHGMTRYFQPSPTSWTMHLYLFPDQCSATTYQGVIQGSTVPAADESRCEAPFWGISPTNYGSPGPYGPLYTHHSSHPWLSPIIRTRLAGEVSERWGTLGAADMPDWYDGSESEPIVEEVVTAHGISRFGTSLEVFGTAWETGSECPMLAVWEATLYRRVP